MAIMTLDFTPITYEHGGVPRADDPGLCDKQSNRFIRKSGPVIEDHMETKTSF